MGDNTIPLSYNSQTGGEIYTYGSGSAGGATGAQGAGATGGTTLGDTGSTIAGAGNANATVVGDTKCFMPPGAKTIPGGRNIFYDHNSGVSILALLKNMDISTKGDATAAAGGLQGQILTSYWDDQQDAANDAVTQGEAQAEQTQQSAYQDFAAMGIELGQATASAHGSRQAQKESDELNENLKTQRDPLQQKINAAKANVQNTQDAMDMAGIENGIQPGSPPHSKPSSISVSDSEPGEADDTSADYKAASDAHIKAKNDLDTLNEKMEERQQQDAKRVSDKYTQVQSRYQSWNQGLDAVKQGITASSKLVQAQEQYKAAGASGDQVMKNAMAQVQQGMMDKWKEFRDADQKNIDSDASLIQQIAQVNAKMGGPG